MIEGMGSLVLGRRGFLSMFIVFPGKLLLRVILGVKKYVTVVIPRIV
jgi:hypothetical protein